MENNVTPIELLFQRAEDYSKTTFTLLKLNAVDKSANMFSYLMIKLTLLLVFTLFLLTFSIGLSLWIGELLGKSYYGFFVVAALYSLGGLLVYIFGSNWIGTPVRTAVIAELLKKEDHERATR
ncbi:hypothetical protein [Cytophaga aurantiaca]|uniref:hypothetical protein n=1 Tax=Cytophaga aurantiaca TaxID=29530 RepID=UPI00037F55D4|nr:hypothetical protein [Cytophaga aurantiaca]